MIKNNFTNNSHFIYYLFTNIIFLSLIFIVIIFSPYIKAQELKPIISDEKPSSTSSATTKQYDLQSIKDDILDLEESYHGQINEYRNLEKEYLVSKNQFHQLETLASLEEAVQKTRSVLLIRSQAFHTYSKLLLFNLILTDNIDPTVKPILISKLENLISALEKEYINIEKISDRVDLKKYATEYEEFSNTINTTTYQTLSAIHFGKINSIYQHSLDLINQLTPDLISQSNQPDVTKRAIDQTLRDLETINTDLEEIQMKLNQDLIENNYSRSRHNNYLNKLDPSYYQLDRIISWLEELKNYQ